MKGFNIGELYIEKPIVQGGMGVGISLAGLASAVANQGGIGVIAAAGIGMLEPDGHSNFLEASKRGLRNEIRKAREATRGIIGVNIMVALSNFGDMVQVSLEEGVDIIFSGSGLPLTLPGYLKEGYKTKLAPIVSSGRAVKMIARRWLERYNYLPDAIVLEGPLAGGHLGFKKQQLSDPDFTLEKLLPGVLDEVRDLEAKHGKAIPIIAGGGIYTGADIYNIMKMGADAVQMATRFVTTHECDADIRFKNTYLEARDEDIVIIDSPVGMPGRALRNEFIDQVMDGKKKPFICPYHCIATCDVENSPYCIALVLRNAQRGNLKHGFAFAGQNAPRATEIISVADLMGQLEAEYEEAARADSSG